MEEIRNIVGRVLEGLHKKEPRGQEQIKEAWTRALGAAQAGCTRIENVDRGTLVVLVDSPARQYHLNLKKKKIVQTLRQEHPWVENIHFKVGNVHE